MGQLRATACGGIAKDAVCEVRERVCLRVEPTLTRAQASLRVVHGPPAWAAVIDYVLLAGVAPAEVVATRVDLVPIEQFEKSRHIQRPRLCDRMGRFRGQSTAGFKFSQGAKRMA